MFYDIKLDNQLFDVNENSGWPFQNKKTEKPYVENDLPRRLRRFTLILLSTVIFQHPTWQSVVRATFML